MNLEVEEQVDGLAGWLEIFVTVNGKKETLLMSSIPYYSKEIWNEKDLNIESIKLSEEYTKKTGETLSIGYFKKFNQKLNEKYSKLHLEKNIYYLERVQSFLTYHIRTLRSIGKLQDKDSMVKYIEKDLVGLSGINLSSFHELIDAVTEKRKEKKKNE